MAHCELFKHIEHHGIQVRVFMYDSEFFIPLTDILKVVDYKGAGWAGIIKRGNLKTMPLAPRGQRGGQLKCILATKVHKIIFRDGYRMNALDDLIGVINSELNIKQCVMDEKPQPDTITAPVETSQPSPSVEELRIKALEENLEVHSKYITELIDDIRALNGRISALESGMSKPKDELTLADVASVLETIKPIL